MVCEGGHTKMGKMGFCNAVFSKKKWDGEIEEQSFFSLENGNISISPQTKIMAKNFNVTGVLLIALLYLWIIKIAC